MQIKIGETLKKLLNYLGNSEQIKPNVQKWFLKQGARDWVEVQQAILYNPERDLAIAVGWREEPEKFQGLIMAEPKGGGEICIIYFRHPATHEVWVSAVPQERKNMSGTHLCAIGVMNDNGSSRDEVRKQLLDKSVGLDEEIFKPCSLKGTPLNSNRLFCLANAKKKEGARFSAVEIPDPREVLDLRETPTGPLAKFKEGATSLDANCQIVFMPWHQLSKKSADALLQAGIVRLMAHLYDEAQA